ncbi:hypothetical protein L6164_024192 [Bauhinia variegata]|uniref:Uncharacterized protein n=1 Tax=Bauhinia variegata TaxID=167791 RepID=A0ACB9LX38_BAUVA|nr:hypothetical protein L6164_024192 [Bauhinia variegata]
MSEKNGNDRLSGTRRTRSQVAPDWTVTESLILVNEIAAVEADCSNALSSYQQWKIIADNCAALEVGRNLNQCRRKWDSLLAEYKKIKGWKSKSKRRSYWSLASESARKFGLPENFDHDLFKAINDLVKARGQRSETDPDSDQEAEIEVVDVVKESGSKRKRKRTKSQRCHAEKPKKCSVDEPLDYLSEENAQRGCSEERPREIHGENSKKNNSDDEYLKDLIEEKPKLKRTEEKPSKDDSEMSLKRLAEVKLGEDHSKESPRKIHVEKKTFGKEENEEMMTLKLQELAEQIQDVCSETAHCRSPDSQNVEEYRTQFIRSQGDRLIASLGDFVDNLKQLCNLVQECE